jgi:hypothetical protein
MADFAGRPATPIRRFKVKSGMRSTFNFNNSGSSFNPRVTGNSFNPSASGQSFNPAINTEDSAMRESSMRFF